MTEGIKLLNKWRKRKGLTLKDVAGLLGCTESYASYIFSGKRKLPTRYIEKLSSISGIPEGKLER